MSEVIVKFVVGLVILLLSTQKLVGLAEKVSRIFRISPLVVGITLVAIGTSLPELTVSVIAIARNDTGLAMGNIVGSNIVNILLIFPVALFIGKLRIGTTKTQRNALFLLGATLIYFATQISGYTSTLTGVLLIGLAIVFSLLEFKLAVIGRDHEDKKQLKSLRGDKFTFGTLFIAIILVLGIIIGGILVVDTIEEISRITGVSTTILGLTLSAVATSLPELLTTIFSQEDNQEKITLGNIIGSNVYNLLLIGGIVSLFTVTNTLPTKDWVWLISATILFVFVIRRFSGRKLPRLIGLIFMGLLLLYLFTQ